MTCNLRHPMGFRHPVPSTATHCNKLQCSALYCDILQHAATTYRRRSCSLINDATHYNALQHTAEHYTALQHTATHYSKLQQLAGEGFANGKHRNAPQHSATYCNTVYCRTQCTATTCGRRSRSLINDSRRAQSPIWKSCFICIVCYIELQWGVAVSFSVLNGVAVCCSVLQCVAVCCSVF